MKQSRVWASMVGGLMLLGGCELILDINSNDAGQDAAPRVPDGGPEPSFPDSGAPTLACATNVAYEDLGVPGRAYRTIAGFDWFDGRARCLEDEADIVSISDPIEHEAMIRLLTTIPAHVNCPNGPCAWVGLSQQSMGEPTDGWTWADGTADDGGLWALPQQPDDIDGVESGEENCAMMEVTSLFDERCSLEWFAICECDRTAL